MGDGIGDVVRPLISAGAKAAARLSAKGIAAARNLGVELFQAAKPVALRAATEVAAAGKDILRQRALKTFLYLGYARQRTALDRTNSPARLYSRGLKTCLYQGYARQRTALDSANSLARLYSRGLKTCLYQGYARQRTALDSANSLARLYSRGLKTCLYQGYARQRTALDSANSLARLYSKTHERCCPGVPLKIWTP